MMFYLQWLKMKLGFFPITLVITIGGFLSMLIGVILSETQIGSIQYVFSVFFATFGLMCFFGGIALAIYRWLKSRYMVAKDK